MPTCMPIENESAVVVDATPLSPYTTSTCCVPTPPGVAGTTVDRPPSTTTNAAVGSEAGSPKATRSAKTAAIRQSHAPACGNATIRAYRPGRRSAASPWPASASRDSTGPARRRQASQTATAARNTAPAAAAGCARSASITGAGGGPGRAPVANATPMSEAPTTASKSRITEPATEIVTTEDPGSCARTNATFAASPARAGSTPLSATPAA